MNLSPVDCLLILIAVADLAVFGLFGFDKAQARNHGQRVRESTLLTAALFGGLGAWFAQHLLRHKTRKEPFRTRLGFVLILHLAAVASLVWFILQRS